jgi:hypothetical protein
MRLVTSGLWRPLAWVLLVAIAFVTLSPLGLRPNSGFSPNYERLFAFALVGCAFALAYPRHIWLVLGFVLAAAVVLEVLQYLAGDRHPRVIDLVAKVIGGGIGVAAGTLLRAAWSRMAPRR